MNLSAVRSAIASAASSVTPALNTYAYVPTSVSLPCFYIGSIELAYDQTFGRGNDDIVLTCVVLVSATSDQSGQAQLDAYLNGSGTNSLKAAIEVDETLGGTCDNVQVARAQNYGYHTVDSVQYLGAELVVQVTGDGG